MIPVSSYQVVEFLEWLRNRQIHIRADDFDEDQIRRFAIEYLESGGIARPARPEQVLEYLLRVFQLCPMIREPSLEEQMEHFARCGLCIEHIWRDIPGVRLGSLRTLHPLLRRFLEYAESSGFAERLRETFDQELPQEPFFQREDDRWFRYAIDRVGSALRDEFQRFIEQADPALVHDYVRNRGASSRFEASPFGTQAESELSRVAEELRERNRYSSV